MPRDARAVMRRAVPRGIQQVGRRRVRVTAERGVAAVALCALLTDLEGACVSRGKQSTTSCRAGVWRQRSTRRCAGQTRRRTLGQLRYGASHPPPLWVTMRRQREAQGTWRLWSVVAKRP
jgi:hypothetical protein